MKAYQLAESDKDIFEDIEIGEYFVSKEELDQGSDSPSLEGAQRFTCYSVRWLMDIYIAIVKQHITKTMHGSGGSAMIKVKKKYLLKDTLETAENKCHHNL